jgi:phosphatidylinositol glycan class A protein
MLPSEPTLPQYPPRASPLQPSATVGAGDSIPPSSSSGVFGLHLSGSPPAYAFAPLNASATSPPTLTPQRKRHRIAMVSDFFYPGFGGVEIHMYNVAQCLLRRGHKVIIITRAYDDRNGVRYTTNGLKVYYVPFVGVKLPPGTVTLPTLWAALPLLRNIYLRERITIVHGHQTTSNLCHEALFHAGTLGLKVCFTDHSLFGFADAASIHINKVLEWSLRCVDQVICVSNTSRENTVLRAKIAPHRVSVIPNATDTASFTPLDTMRYRTWSSVGDDITIVVVTRLVYRKGSDLFVDVIPEICRRHPRIKWVVGGDGPRKPQLDRMVDKHGLHDRVKLLGALKHTEVRSVLCQGQIFLNCSLTEAFCIALIEAASCGLLCVSTGVGGVPEVLPEDMLLLAQPEPNSIIAAVEEAIRRVPRVSPWEMHDNVRRYYSWDWVAERTERVFDRVSGMPSLSVVERLVRYAAVGRVYGFICVCICVVDWLLLQLIEWWRPAKNVEVAVDFPVRAYAAHRDAFVRGSDRSKMNPLTANNKPLPAQNATSTSANRSSPAGAGAGGSGGATGTPSAAGVHGGLLAAPGPRPLSAMGLSSTQRSDARSDALSATARPEPIDVDPSLAAAGASAGHSASRTPPSRGSGRGAFDSNTQAAGNGGGNRKQQRRGR